MKQCPTCQKEFPDSMRFCQVDGTPLVEKAEQAPPPDPYKTVVGGMIKMDEDLLQLPPQDDPNKTMVSPISMPKPEAPKAEPPKPFNEPPKVESQPPVQPQPPKFSEPGLNAPSFGDLSPTPAGNVSGESSSRGDAPKSGSIPPPNPFNAPKSGSEKEAGSPWASSEKEAGKSESPFDKPKGPPSSSPFDKPSGSPSSPFDKPSGAPSSPFEKTPPPPYKEPEPKLGGQGASPFGQSPFDQPKTPFGQSSEPLNQGMQQNEWAPPPAPVAGWQDQGLGGNTPFQPPVAGGQNQTLAIVSLVLGVLSLFCCAWFVPGIVAVVLGFMAKNKADQNPSEFAGRGLALGGIITGGISILLGIIVSLLYLLGAFAGRF